MKKNEPIFSRVLAKGEVKLMGCVSSTFGVHILVIGETANDFQVFVIIPSSTNFLKRRDKGKAGHELAILYSVFSRSEDELR